MKRPSRPAKRKVASKKITKRVKKTTPQKPRAAPEWNAEDAAVFDIPKPPASFAYQWAPLSRIEYMRRKGWTQVPYSRHPEMPLSTNFDGYIVYRDTTLFQMSEELVRVELDRAKLNAKDQVRDFHEALGIEAPYMDGGGRFATIFHILSPSFMVSSDYEGVRDDAPDRQVMLNISFIMPARWQDAAAALNLAPEVYCQRRIAMENMLIRPDRDLNFHPAAAPKED